MPGKKYKVTLTKEERQTLLSMVNIGTGKARRLRRARILLMADEDQQNGGWPDKEIAQALGAHVNTVERVRKACVEQGIEAALNHTKPYKTRRKVLDGAAEARLIQLACSPVPDGHESWTMQMLAEKLIELKIVESVSGETVRTTLKKTNLSRG